LATIVDYINVYRITPPSGRSHLFEAISCYIASYCSKKTSTRINHWASIDYIRILGEIKPEDVRTLYNEFEQKENLSPNLGKSNDSAFRFLLHDLGEEGVREVMKEHPDADPRNTSLTNLQAAFTDKPASDTSYSAYAFAEFHEFFIAVIHGYRHAVKEYREVEEEPDKDACQKTIRERGAKLFRFMTFFWRIAYSRMLRYYLSILGAGGRLLLLPDEAGRTEDDGDNGDGDDGADDESRPRTYLQHGNFNPYFQWIRLQVVSFASLNALTLFSVQCPADINISLVAVRKSRNNRGSLEGWQDTMSKLNDTSQRFDTDRAIKLIENEIKDM
jgi:hypothetical protein